MLPDGVSKYGRMPRLNRSSMGIAIALFSRAVYSTSTLVYCRRLGAEGTFRYRESDFRGLIHKEFTPTLFPVTGDKPNPCEILEPVGAGGMGFCDARWWILGYPAKARSRRQCSRAIACRRAGTRSVLRAII